MIRHLRLWLMLSLPAAILSIGFETSDHAAGPVEFGKIYLQDDLLIVSELAQGIRFLDITLPSFPASVGFIRIVGNHDMALSPLSASSRRYMYADADTNLLVVDVTNPREPVVVDTVTNIFREAYRRGWGEIDMFVNTPMPGLDHVGGVEGCAGCSQSDVVTGSAAVPAVDRGMFDFTGYRSGGGKGGSMARFAVADGYLYCIDYNQLYVFELENPALPRLVNTIYVGWGIETLFPYDAFLFIGGQNGMYIYSRLNPEKPEYISTYEHVRSCDPVVVEDSLAYVTLRGGTRCGTVVSALHVLSVADLFHPSLLASYPMPQPMGLDVSDRVVYVCDDTIGIAILNAADPHNIVELAVIPGQHGYDAITSGVLLIVTSRSSISLYNVSDPAHPFLLGRYGV